MAGSTISTFIYGPVVLGTANYGSPLTIAYGGWVSGVTPGTHQNYYTNCIEVSASVAKPRIVNYGHIVTGYLPGSSDFSFGVGGGTNLYLRNAGFIYGAYGVTAGGKLVNSGSIGGARYGIVFSTGSIVNSGSVSGIHGGIVLDGNDSLQNSANGKIEGIIVKGAAASIVNRGYISPIYNAFYFGGGITGYSKGIRITNSGKIEGGISISAGGTATIINTGIIIGSDGIVASDSTIRNSGYIGGAYGVSLTSGMLTNTGTIDAIVASDSTIKNSGTISGPLSVSLTGGMLINSGTIDGAVEQFGGTIVSSGTIFNAGYDITMYGGSLTNTGGISGGVDGVIVGKNMTGGSLTNLGTISGGIGVALISGYVENKKDVTGTIGVELTGGTVMNSGEIIGETFGVYLQGGSLTNSKTISGPIGVKLTGGSLMNAHDIYGQTIGLGVTGGSATNTGVISAVTGVSLSAGNVGNSGKISGTADGVSLSGGTLFNRGDITGKAYGVTISGGTLITGGTIEGKLDAVRGESIHLIVDPGAVFQGKVIAQGSDNSLELATREGAISGVGSRFLGFDEITFATGSTWTLEGTKAGLTTGQQIYGFATGDRIVLDGFTAQSEHFVNGIGLILGSHGGVTETLGINGALHTADFTVTSQSNHTTITLDTASGSSAAKMTFLSPRIGGHGVSPTATSPADLFADTRSPKYSASYLSKAPNLAPAAATISALHGFGPAATATDAAAHDAKVISIPTFGI